MSNDHNCFDQVCKHFIYSRQPNLIIAVDTTLSVARSHRTSVSSDSCRFSVLPVMFNFGELARPS